MLAMLVNMTWLTVGFTEDIAIVFMEFITQLITAGATL